MMVCDLAENFDVNAETGEIAYAKAVFKEMLSDKALKKADVYLNEEQIVLENLICNTPQVCKMNFCIIGGGPFYYLSLAARYFSKYTLIDPNFRCFMNNPDMRAVKKLENIKCIECVEKSFEDYCQAYTAAFDPTNTLYVFWFNVISYIQNPIELLNRIVRAGDIVFISKWNDSVVAQKTQEDYFDHINNGTVGGCRKVLPVSSDLVLDEFYPASNIQCIRQETTDITVVHI